MMRIIVLDKICCSLWSWCKLVLDGVLEFCCSVWSWHYWVLDDDFEFCCSVWSWHWALDDFEFCCSVWNLHELVLDDFEFCCSQTCQESEFHQSRSGRGHFWEERNVQNCIFEGRFLVTDLSMPLRTEISESDVWINCPSGQTANQSRRHADCGTTFRCCASATSLQYTLPPLLCCLAWQPCRVGTFVCPSASSL